MVYPYRFLTILLLTILLLCVALISPFQCAKSAGNDKSCPDAVARERERMNINRSLLTLGRVITVLKEKSLNKSTNARIPYR